MSVQFGIFNFDGKPVEIKDLERVRPILAPYGPDGEGLICKNNLAVLYLGLNTTKESRSERQPYCGSSNSLLTWDGRLDNRTELIEQLAGALSSDSPDVHIVAECWERWGTGAFERLIGDWSLSIWNPRDQSLTLVKDCIGAHHLYYAVQKERVLWSTILDPLVLLAGRLLPLEEEYIAGWLTGFPATHLTPYLGIHAVPSSSFVSLMRGSAILTRYWDFDCRKMTRCIDDHEYEERFHALFSNAVRRRLRSDSPVLAELSGGIDSTSIVCTADQILEEENIGTPRLDTISYYDDGEPNWNERRYFTEVEQKRGRIGCHIDVGAKRIADSESGPDNFGATPAHGAYFPNIQRLVADCMNVHGNRVLLSGVGGDEVTGGVPTPFPELADAFAQGHFRELMGLLKIWALNKRQPCLHLLGKTLASFIHPKIIGPSRDNVPPPWLKPKFEKRNFEALTGYPRRLKLRGALPSFQENLTTLNNLRRQLSCSVTACDPPHETRYPYLDRDLLEFLYSIPREQLVRPGQRRSLMRRAMRGRIPSAIIDRRRKASVSLGPIRVIERESARLCDGDCNLISSELGIVDPVRFRRAIHDVRAGRERRLVAVLRTLDLESWLRQLLGREIPLLRRSGTNDLTGVPSV